MKFYVRKPTADLTPLSLMFGRSGYHLWVCRVQKRKGQRNIIITWIYLKTQCSQGVQTVVWPLLTRSSTSRLYNFLFAIKKECSFIYFVLFRLFLYHKSWPTNFWSGPVDFCSESERNLSNYFACWRHLNIIRLIFFSFSVELNSIYSHTSFKWTNHIDSN